MTTEKLLEIVNTMIDNATKEQKDIIRIMRKDGIKDGKNLTFANAGIEMETLRNILIEDLQAAEMKSCGKSKTFSAIKRYVKHCNKNMVYKPMWQTSWKLKDGRYITLDGCSMLITENADGLILKENPSEYETAEAQRMADSQLANTYSKETILPELGKITAYMKRKKAENKNWNKTVGKREPFIIDGIWLNFDYIVYAMEITCSNVLHHNGNGKALMMQGNGNIFLFMPVYMKEEKADTVL